MRTFWILIGVFASTSAIVHNKVKRTDGYISDKENEITSESLNTGEFMPVKKSLRYENEEDAGEVGYKFEVAEEVDKIEKPVLTVKENSTEKLKSLKHEPIIRYLDPYISAQNSYTNYRPPGTSYGVPFYNTYPLPTKFKSVPVSENIKTHLTKFKTPQSNYIIEQKSKYQKMDAEDTKNMKTNNFGTFENINENFDYGTKDYFQDQELNQFQPYDSNIKSDISSEKPGENVYYTDGHEFPPESNYYGLLHTNSNDLGQVEYVSNEFDGYTYPKLNEYEDEIKNSFPVMKNVYMPKEYNYGSVKDFEDGPGNGYFFTKFPNYSSKKRESYIYEVPLKYKSLLFSGNGQMYGKSMQSGGKEYDVSSELHASTEFFSPWLQVGNYLSQNQEYLGTSAFKSGYGNSVYSFRKPETNMYPRYTVYKIYKRAF